jgi:hypothetical protein
MSRKPTPIYQIGDIIDEYWKAPTTKPEYWKTGRYLIYDKKQVYCEISDMGYTDYKALVLYYKPPAGFEDDGIYPPLKPGRTRTIMHWSDDHIRNRTTKWVRVHKSNLQWKEDTPDDKKDN